jgi:hypothetical protein
MRQGTGKIIDHCPQLKQRAQKFKNRLILIFNHGLFAKLAKVLNMTFVMFFTCA